MEKYLNRGIKDVIKEFPGVGDILENIGVGCISCNIGTCLLKDVIGIHNLSKKEEIFLMANIEKTIYPDRNVTFDVSDFDEKPLIKHDYSKPVKELIEEHDNIKILLRKIPQICEEIILSDKVDYTFVLECVEFIQNYADKFHHSKEEDILFKYVKKDFEVVNVMLEEHKLARWFIKSILKGVEAQNPKLIAESLSSYGELLLEHIKKEDEILYPYIDSTLSEIQIDELAQCFKEVDAKTGESFTIKWTSFLSRL